MATVGGITGVEQLHTVLFQACCQAFPKEKTVSVEKPWQSAAVQHGIKDLWARWRSFQTDPERWATRLVPSLASLEKL